MSGPALDLKNFQFNDLFHAAGLQRLDETFLHFLATHNPDLKKILISYRTNEHQLTTLEISEFLIQTAKALEIFLIDFFNIEKASDALTLKVLANNPISAFKNTFVLRKAKKLVSKAHTLPSFAELNNWLQQQLDQLPYRGEDLEMSVALLAQQYNLNPEKYASEIEQLTAWCAQALASEAGQEIIKHWTSFRLPARLDYANLIPLQTYDDKFTRKTVTAEQLRLRDGFKLTDQRMNARQVQDEVNYCIYCHDHDGDFCSKGFPVKKSEPELGFKKNPLDVILTGCPLEEKISEMNILKRDGANIAALAMVMLDNPMCPATGHRICNDCMKACIYQKQEPVNIPQIETHVLTDVLGLPWGVEIYDLLTRWNPLRPSQFVMKPYNGLKILIAGMGPAGFTLAHHLLQEGFAVVGFDGLKIEPLPQHLITQPIYEFDSLKEDLDSRLMAGFGGVAEYGITVRWDKNFLKLIYISLMRRPYFQVFGNARFGGTVTVDDAWDLGFDHFVLAVGAGLPKALPIPGSLAAGMRQANDFLMALQLGNAAKKESLTNIQIRLPAVIIGGGLTGVDTATEVQAYYITQVEKILTRYEILVKEYSEDYILKTLDVASIEILEEFLQHGKAVRKERERAYAEKVSPNFIKLIRQWGGVSIVYRRDLQSSPAYVNNHEELYKALEEGIFYLEKLDPATAILNQFGHVETLVCHKRILNEHQQWETLNEEIRIPARSIFIATGTQPNIAYEFEHRGTFVKQDHRYQTYQAIENELTIAPGITQCKDPEFGAFTSYKKHQYRVTLIGDTHPVFHGNVVKAIASGMRTYPKIVNLFQDKLSQLGEDQEYQRFAEKMVTAFNATVSAIERFSNNVLELTVKAPLVAKKFQPGQFYRLQNYESYSQKLDHTTLQMEPLALLCTDVNKQHETLSFMIIENGATSRICSTFKIGEPIALMGPTGVRSKISKEHETVMIIGNQLSIATMLTYGKALKAKGNRVLYVTGYENAEELYCQNKIENIADVIVWTVQNNQQITPARSQDYSAKGSVIDVLKKYSDGLLDVNKRHAEISLQDIDRIFVVGDATLLKNFQRAREEIFKQDFVKNPRVFGSVYSTMQCMLKGVCAQCLQWQIDPETKKRTKAVFACSWQDQPLELIDFDNLVERQIQNRLQEKLSTLWVDYLFEKYQIEHV